MVSKIVTIIKKNYNWSLNWSLKLVIMVLATKEDWLLKVSYLSSGYQNDLVSKFVSN